MSTRRHRGINSSETTAATIIAEATEHAWCCRFGNQAGVLTVRRTHRPGNMPASGGAIRRLVFLSEGSSTALFGCNMADVEEIEVVADELNDVTTPARHHRVDVTAPVPQVCVTVLEGRNADNTRPNRVVRTTFSHFEGAESVAQTLAALMLVEKAAALNDAEQEVFVRNFDSPPPPLERGSQSTQRSDVQLVDLVPLDDDTSATEMVGPVPTASMAARAEIELLPLDDEGEVAIAMDSRSTAMISHLHATCSWPRVVPDLGDVRDVSAHQEWAELGSAVAASIPLIHRIPMRNVAAILRQNDADCEGRRSGSYGSPSRQMRKHVAAEEQRVLEIVGSNTDHDSFFVAPSWRESEYAESHRCDIHVHIPIAYFPATTEKLVFYVASSAVSVHLSVLSADGSRGVAEATAQGDDDDDEEELVKWWTRCLADTSGNAGCNDVPPLPAAARSNAANCVSFNLLRVTVPLRWCALRDVVLGGMTLKLTCECGSWPALMLSKVVVVTRPAVL